jgi:ABC-type nickel/cobalt efflux system permease component RcnA
MPIRSDLEPSLGISNWFFSLLTGLMLLAGASPCLAHPMGNFSINHYSGVHVARNFVEVRYIIDIAEIPTYQEIQNAGIVAQSGDPSLASYLTQQTALWNKNLHLEIDGETIRLSLVSDSIIFPPGAGGLPTMKIGVVYRGVFLPSKSPSMRLHYADSNYEGHAGWKEIVVSGGKGVTFEQGQRFQTDRSQQLSNYPTNLLESPPQDLEADVAYKITAGPSSADTSSSATVEKQGVQSTSEHRVETDLIKKGSTPQMVPPTRLSIQTVSPALQLLPNKQATPRSRFTELMTNQRMSLWFLLSAAFFAMGLGALHALEPGHGKTIVAAYLVGSRGRTRHAVGLGLLVTAAHTAGVYMLGALVLYASKYIIPEQIYPWLSIFSGMVIALLALYLLLRAWTGLEAPDAHDEGVLHTHWYSLRRSPIETEAALAQSALSTQERTVSLKQLLLLGITGGIIPCPAALVVLLSAVSLHRIALGLFLIVAFSLGLAAVLIGIGIAMVKARSLLSRWRSDSPLIKRWLPFASASAMLIAGLAIAGSALPATGLRLHVPDLAGGRVASFAAIVVLGLVLGVRHSTDPDHVVAVSTIVSRERSVRHGAVIGMMWGLGHTLTIFVVGAAIILFNLTIPPRLGLSMEMAVAAMLILLGILNLTGVLQRLTRRFTPDTQKPKSSSQASEYPASGTGDEVTFGLFRRLLRRFGYYHLLRPLAIGLVHGLAGSAAVALLVLSMIHSPAWAIAYLVVFGLGTVVGMMLMTTVMAIPIALTGQTSSRYLTMASGLVSVCFGLFLVYQLGFVDGLFTSHAHWTPE